MDRLQSPSALNDETACSPAEGGLRGLALLPEGNDDSANAASAWIVIVAGLLAAGAMAWLLCRLPLVHALSWGMLLLQAAGYVALTTAAGTVGIWALWSFLTIKPSFGPGLLSKHAGVGWVFLPGITLLDRQQSLWVLLMVALATVALAVSLRRLFPVDAEASQEDSLSRQTGDLPTLYGLPTDDASLWRTFFIALCAQASLIFAFAGMLSLASVLLSICLFVLLWRRSASDSSMARRTAGKRPLLRLILLSAFAIFATSLALIWVGGGYFAWRLHGLFGPGSLPRKSPIARPQAETPDSSYVGIVLWPPPKEKTEIIPPTPQAHSFGIESTSKPLVIPFDGPYWYVDSDAPRKTPGPQARIEYGKPTDLGINFHTVDRDTLLMEAHQNLGSSIDLGCCSELEIAITNADTRPGKIELGVRLMDSTSPGKPSQFLGLRAIASSEAARISITRPPVQEILRFPISQSGEVHRFDEITVVFLPAKERDFAGAKVSIQTFTLIPK